MRSLILALVVASSPAWAQAPAPRPLDPALTGTWEMVEFVLPDEPGGPDEVIRMRLTIDGSTVTQTDAFRVAGEVVEREVTVECFVYDVDLPLHGPNRRRVEDVVGCGSAGGAGMGTGGYGPYAIEGDTLTFSMPEIGYRVLFRRAEG